MVTGRVPVVNPQAAISVGGALTAGRDLIVQFGLTSAPTNFRSVVARFVRFYLGDKETPVPFGGRTAEIDTLNAWLQNLDGEVDLTLLKGDRVSNNLLITAPAGRGKTALLVRWIEQLSQDWDIVFVPVSIRYQTNQAITFYQALAARLGTILGETLPEPRTDPTAYYREKVIEYTDRIAEAGHRCLVVIDGLDEARGWKIDTTVLPPTTPSTLKIVISARELAGDKGSSDWLDRLGWTPPQSEACTLRVPLLSQNGVKDVLERMGFPLVRLSANIDIVDELYRLTEKGDPLLLQLYSRDLMGAGEAARLRPEDLRKLDPGFGAYFKRWLEDQRDEWRLSGLPIDADLLNAILAVLAIAFGPLKLTDLEELIGRILPGERIFTATSVEPLQRFILGDGVFAGYALAHPKLGVYLQNEYFGKSKILGKTQEALLQWMRGVVQGVNADTLPLDQCPEYVLLFYSQHLTQFRGDTGLVQFRELLENGWRNAWEHYEGGLQGFYRDVELARKALQDAVDQDSRRLRQSNIGLGALIRCALIISSIRSIGSGLPGILLAEFLTSGSITPKQALQLVQFKDDKGRIEAIPMIMPKLGPEMRSEAYALLRDIRDPEEQIRALTSVIEYLLPVEQEPAAREILRISQKIKEHTKRLSALNDIKAFLPTDVWFEAVSSERERGTQEIAAAEEELTEHDENGFKRIDRQSSFKLGSDLQRESEENNLSDAKKRDILYRVKTVPSVYMPKILHNLAPSLTADLLDLALTCIWTHEDQLFHGEALKEVAPYLSPQAGRENLRVALNRLSYDLDSVITPLASLLSADDLRGLFDEILDLKDDNKKERALVGLVPHISEELRSVALAFVLKQDSYRMRRSLEKIVPYLSERQLSDATARIGAMDIEERGKTLAVLMPRYHQLGLSLTATDAYRMSFAIGDRLYRNLAEAALRSGAQEQNNSAITSTLRRTLFEFDPAAGQVGLVIQTITAMFLSRNLPESARNSLLDECALNARSLSDPEERFIVLSLIATQLGLETGKALRNEAIQLANSENMDFEVVLIFATLFPPDEARLLLLSQKSTPKAAVAPVAKDAIYLEQIVRALVEESTPEAMKAAITSTVQKIVFEKSRREACPLLLFALIVSPTLPPKELDKLVAQLITSLDDERDEFDRCMVVLLMSSYVPAEFLVKFVKQLLSLAQTLSRPELLTGLVLANGIARELWVLNPVAAGNMIAESALVRLGGDTILTETLDAIGDVCDWWA